MARQNKISTALSGVERQAILTKVNDIEELLPFLLNRSNHERKKVRQLEPRLKEVSQKYN